MGRTWAGTAASSSSTYGSGKADGALSVRSLCPSVGRQEGSRLRIRQCIGRLGGMKCYRKAGQAGWELPGAGGHTCTHALVGEAAGAVSRVETSPTCVFRFPWLLHGQAVATMAGKPVGAYA